MAGKLLISVAAIVAIFFCAGVCFMPDAQKQSSAGGCHEKKESKSEVSRHCCIQIGVLEYPATWISPIEGGHLLGGSPGDLSILSHTIPAAYFHSSLDPPNHTVLRI